MSAYSHVATSQFAIRVRESCDRLLVRSAACQLQASADLMVMPLAQPLLVQIISLRLLRALKSNTTWQYHLLPQREICVLHSVLSIRLVERARAPEQWKHACVRVAVILKSSVFFLFFYHVAAIIHLSSLARPLRRLGFGTTPIAQQDLAR